MITVHGLGNIKATIVKDSVSPNGVRLLTYELEYPRIIHSEVMTHCMLEKNAASSRAIPVATMLELIENNPAMPVEWGTNNPGMVSKTLMDAETAKAAEGVWLNAMKDAVAHARVISEKNGINAHKQCANRLTEAYQFMKTVMTGTEWANLFWLRDHPDADPTFHELARCMNVAREQSVPVLLQPGQWHLPYVDFVDGKYFSNGIELELETAKKVSASCTAQVSYRKLNDSVEQADKVFGMLNLGSDDKPAHASPVAHQATPMKAPSVEDMNEINLPRDFETWEPGITHVRRNGTLWSGKLRGWIQLRQLIPNEAKWD